MSGWGRGKVNDTNRVEVLLQCRHDPGCVRNIIARHQFPAPQMVKTFGRTFAVVIFL
jgi:hypothetical protein